jgi:uncharacterized glyoxalase superfamily protein PhnB
VADRPLDDTAGTAGAPGVPAGSGVPAESGGFGRLRLPLTAVSPDPQFAADLRARVQRALTLPKGVSMTTSTAPRSSSTDEAGTQPAQAPGGAIPYLAVRDGRQALAWYTEVLGAVVRGEPIVMPDNRIGHAELEIGGGLIYLADEFPDLRVIAPTRAGSPVSLVLAVADVDALVPVAERAGAEVLRHPEDNYGHRGATVVDPFGHRWMLQTALAPDLSVDPAARSPRHGDVAYVSAWLPDVAAGGQFYAQALGWEYASADGPGRYVVGSTLAQGIYGGVSEPTLFCCYYVDDLSAALAQVVAHGGSAGEVESQSFGMTALCRDPSGGAFSLVEGPGQESDRSPLNGGRAGDLCYLTIEVTETASARAFYGAVLGWTFEPGHVDDGWAVQNSRPMVGLHGGHAKLTGVPMWLVADVEASVRQVIAAGGTSGPVERQPYGLSATCRDNQGSAFYLGQL